MAHSIELLKAMDGQHAVNALRADFDPIVNTPLESFLLDWVESLVDEVDSDLSIEAENHGLDAEDIKALGEALIEDADNTVALLSVIGKAGTDVDELKGVFALIEVLDEAGIDTPETLKARLALADQFRALANDAGDVFSRLTELTTGATA